MPHNHRSDMVYPHEAFSFAPVQNAFSSVENGISGIIWNNNRQYTYLKSNPHAKSGSGGSARDPVSRKVMWSRSTNWKNQVGKYYDQLHKTERQIRINEFTRSGGSLPRPHGFEYTSDYHRQMLSHHSTSYVTTAIILLGIYFVFLK